MSQERLERNLLFLWNIVRHAPAADTDAEHCIIDRGQVFSILDDIAVCLRAIENEHKKRCEDCSL